MRFDVFFLRNTGVVKFFCCYYVVYLTLWVKNRVLMIKIRLSMQAKYP